MNNFIQIKTALLSSYDSLSAKEKRLIEIMALMGLMQGRKDELFRKIASFTEKKEQKLTNLHLKASLKQLKEKDLLIDGGDCHPFILHDIAAKAVSDANSNKEDNLQIVRTFCRPLDHLDFSLVSSPYYYHELLRAVHIALHANDLQLFNKIKTKNLMYSVFLMKMVMGLLNDSLLDIDWVKTRHPIIQLALLCAKFGYCCNVEISLPVDIDLWLDFLKTFSLSDECKEAPFLISQLQQIYLYHGLLDKLPELTPAYTSSFAYQERLALCAFIDGNTTMALKHYEKAITAYQQYFNDRQHYWYVLNDINNLFYVLSLLANADKTKIDKVLLRIKKMHRRPTFFFACAALVYLYRNERGLAMENRDYLLTDLEQLNDAEGEGGSLLLLVLSAWIETLLSPEISELDQAENIKLFFVFLEHDALLVAHIFGEAMSMVGQNNADLQDFLNNKTLFPNLRFSRLIPYKAHWETAIDKISELMLISEVTSSSTDKRLVWLINLDDHELFAHEQKRQKKGGWSSGKALPLKRLFSEQDSFTYLTTQDKQALSGLLRKDNDWYYGSNQYYWDFDKTIMLLVGHPLLFDANNPNLPIELTEGMVELKIAEKAEGYHLVLTPYDEQASTIVEKEGPGRYKVTSVSAEAAKIMQVLPKSGLTIPFAAKEKVNAIINYVGSSIHVQADVKEDNIPEVESQSTCLVHLFPKDDGFRLEAWVKPFGEKGAYCRIGQGNQTLIMTVDIDGKATRQKTVRDFKKEKAALSHLIKSCPSLQTLDQKNDEWEFNSVETCLEVLVELEEYKKNHSLIMEWPKGQTVKLKQSVSSNNVSLSIKGSQYWFEYEGEVALDNERALDIKMLLDLLDDSEGRFIKLPDGEFLALTAQFKKQLEDLKAVSEGNKIYHLGAGALTSLSEVAGNTETDAAWQAHLKKITSMQLYQPQLPSTLQADLREYQEEGFHYLSRLANWEIGACLADDMGLGKTLQTIAVLLEKGKLGASIVVAPTSVCFTWVEELTRFAPTLKPHLLSAATDRAALIDSMNPMDILICSYGLLQTASKELIDKNWQLIILDEAQAIKNANTKRWKYATQLNGKARIALSGTPIENHLGELWSIFRFLNPGLLGSEKHFRERYAQPIERLQDPIAKRALKLLVSPYILRRTKSEVLQELPAKTEQSIIIEPTAEEKAFYEAVRLKAMERIHQLNIGKDDKKTKRFSILAEITRLRQACCHSLLVDESIDIPSSKIKTFIELVHNLLENKHKVLVFSQYVRYLQIVKEVLNKEKISYQYLDGATPAKTRQKAINSFQSGEGDVFLISLKAGGTGLNLTAADYVIILDPWWNPAVEDQASARAHRMGQERPVTVYRLIMQNTMEEKIVQLHQQKRDLADDLLSGSDMSGKISEEELIQLIAS